MCHGVCQVLVHMEGERVVKVTGDPDSPTSRGYICPKGAASPELLYHPDRVLHPLRRKGKRGENKWERISWDEALDEMAGKLAEIRKRHGAHYLGMMHGTGRPYENFGQRFANALWNAEFYRCCPCLFLAACLCEYGNAGLYRDAGLRRIRSGRNSPALRHDLGLQPYRISGA